MGINRQRPVQPKRERHHLHAFNMYRKNEAQTIPERNRTKNLDHLKKDRHDRKRNPADHLSIDRANHETLVHLASQEAQITDHPVKKEVNEARTQIIDHTNHDLTDHQVAISDERIKERLVFCKKRSSKIIF